MTEPTRQILVADVPADATAEEAEALLNAVCDRGYYVLAITPGLNGGARGFFGRRREPKSASRLRNRDGREAEALDIIRRWSDESCRVLQKRLGAAGIKRGHSWVSEKRALIRGGAANG